MRINLTVALETSLSNFASAVETWFKVPAVGRPPQLVAAVDKLREAHEAMELTQQFDMSTYGFGPAPAMWASSASAGHFQPTFMPASQTGPYPTPLLYSGPTSMPFQGAYSGPAAAPYPGPTPPPHPGPIESGVLALTSPESAKIAKSSVLHRLGPEVSEAGSSGQGGRDAFGCIPGIDPPPSQGKKSFCFNFLRGQFHWPICDFNHYTAVELKAIHCPSFTKLGSCKYGPDCVYRHL